MDTREKRFWELYHGEDYFKESGLLKRKPTLPPLPEEEQPMSGLLKRKPTLSPLPDEEPMSGLLKPRPVVDEMPDPASLNPWLEQHSGIDDEIAPFDPTLDDPLVFGAISQIWQESHLDVSSPSAKKRIREEARNWVRNLNNRGKLLKPKPEISE